MSLQPPSGTTHTDREIPNHGDYGSRLVVLGAGADVPLNLPTVTNLGQALTDFVRGPGAQIERALRERLRPMRFNLGMVVGDSAERLVRQLFEEPKRVAGTLRGIRDKVADTGGRGPVGEVLDQLCDMADKNVAPPDLAQRLGEIAGLKSDDAEPAFLLDPRRLPLDRIVRKALRTTFEGVLLEPTLSTVEREFVRDVVAATSSIEELLASLFPSFSAVGLLAERRRYLYVVWLLWAYIKIATIAAVKDGTPSICRLIAGLGLPVITFNYTDFFPEGYRDQVCHFHGSYKGSLKIDTREEAEDDARLAHAQDAEGICDLFKSQLRLDVDAGDALDVPAFVPPLSFKPVMSPARLREWARADDMVRKATHFLIVGYSFSQVDAHFNALLRSAPADAAFVSVNPDLERTTGQLLRALGDPKGDGLVTGGALSNNELIMGRVKGVRASAESLTQDRIRELFEL